MYYLLNVRPNKNQSAGEFFHSLVSRLVKKNEALVIMHNDELYLADSFNIEEKNSAFEENIYSDITIGGYEVKGKYKESDVLHMKLNNENIKTIIDDMYKDYGTLIDSASKLYKRKNVIRVVVDSAAISSLDPKAQKDKDELLNSWFKSWFEADSGGAVLPVPKGITVQDWSGMGNAKNSIMDSRDIKHLIDDIFDLISAAIHVPKGILKGDMAETGNQTDNLIMFCIKPIVELLKDEINGKIYKKLDFFKRNYLKIDTTKIKVIDIVQFANAVDKLFAAGVNTINDNLYMLDRERVDEEFADTRFVTKNYTTLQRLGSGVVEEEGGNSVNEKQ